MTTRTHSFAGTPAAPGLLFFFGYGLAAWLAFTLLFRLVGQFFLNPDSPAMIGLTFAITLPAMLAITYPLYARFRLDAEQRARAAATMALPGLLLDALATLLFTWFFPNLAPSMAASYAALMLWGYAIVLLTGVVPGSRFSPWLFAGLSLLVWFLVAGLFRAAGQLLFSPETPATTWLMFGLMVALAFVVALPLYGWRRVPGQERAAAALWLTVPGMFLDVVAVWFFAAVFPNMAPEVAATVGAWLLWGNALLIVTGLLPARNA